MPLPYEKSRVDNFVGKFIKYQTITWIDNVGVERQWETVERARELPAVMIIPWFRPSQRLLLIRQYRPPANKMIIEFPAGLMESGEKPEIAAIRELREETGYEGSIVGVTAPTYNTPGLSGEAVYTVDVAIADGAVSRPQPDVGEYIENLIIERAQIAEFLQQELAAGNYFDSKVMAYLRGMLAANHNEHKC